VFAQAAKAMESAEPKMLLLSSRVWKVKFIGEGLDDIGGGYSDSISEMCDELATRALPLLITSHDAADHTSGDALLLNPECKQPIHAQWFEFLGVLMGIAIRTNEPIDLNLAPQMWKLIAGGELSVGDLSELDSGFVSGLQFWRDVDDEEALSALSLPGVGRITMDNRDKLIQDALTTKLHEYDAVVAQIRQGLSKVLPLSLLSLLTGDELRVWVCGEPNIDIALLKSVTSYKGGLSDTSDLIKWFWEAMEEFTPTQRSLFVRFAWGRSRLPRTKADFKGREFQIQRLDKFDDQGQSDKALPEAYTCFFLLKLPTYSSKAVLVNKLTYAINFCKNIDSDAYARTELEGVEADDGEEHNDDEDEEEQDYDEGSGSDDGDWE